MELESESRRVGERCSGIRGGDVETLTIHWICGLMPTDCMVAIGALILTDSVYGSYRCTNTD